VPAQYNERVIPEAVAAAEAGEDWPALRAELVARLGGEGRRELSLFKLALLERWLGTSGEALLREVSDRISLRRFCLLEAAEDLAPSSLHEFQKRLAAAGAAGMVDRVAERWAGPAVSVVSAVYQAADIVDELIRRLTAELDKQGVPFEIILVDDGSSDDGWARVRAAAQRDSRIKGVRLSRNFGQHFAITAGLDLSRGRWVVVMDCDLQDDPGDIAALLAKAREGFDVVYAVKRERRHAWWKNLAGTAFAAALNRLSSGNAANPLVGTFSVLSRPAVDAFCQLRETHRHYLSVLNWLGFASAEVPVEHRERYRGASSYSLAALVRHAVVGLTAYTDSLLYVGLGCGALFLAASLVGAAYLVTMYFLHGYREGWTSTMVLMLLSTSAVLLSIGTVGMYVGKIFDQVKQRPLYVTRERINL
jgi:dolichol-phosphate mannosyltransferase